MTPAIKDKIEREAKAHFEAEFTANAEADYITAAIVWAIRCEPLLEALKGVMECSGTSQKQYHLAKEALDQFDKEVRE